MEAEELLKYLKKCVEEKMGDDVKALITPTMYDPTKMQYDVSFIIMEKVEGGTIPRFTVNVKDNTKRNFN
jgi:xylose isomerase